MFDVVQTWMVGVVNHAFSKTMNLAKEYKELYYSVPDDLKNYQPFWAYFYQITKEPNQTAADNNTLLLVSLIRRYLGTGGIDSCSEDLQCSILKYLIHCLKSNNNQFVNFNASKALVSSLKIFSSKTSGKCIQEIISIFTCCKRDLYVAIYALQTISEILKTCRKDTSGRNTISSTADSCLTTVSLNWESIAANLCVDDAGTTQLSHLVLEQGLSLCLECLRLQTTIDSRFTRSLPLLARAVVASSSLLCKTKLVSIMRKMMSKLSEPLVINDFQTLRCDATSIVGKWFALESGTVYASIVIECDIDSPVDVVATGVVISHLERIFLRKYFLLSLQLASFTTDHLSANSLCNVTHDFLLNLRMLSLQNYQIPEQLTMLFLQKLILHLVAEEDGCLVTTFVDLLKISELTEFLPTLIVQVYNIHHFFSLFLSSVGFDASTILDLVISNETAFDAFFCNYLRLITTDCGGNELTSACQETDAQTTIGRSEECIGFHELDMGETDISNELETSITDDDLLLLPKGFLEKLLNCFSSMYTKLDNAVEKELVAEEKLTVVSEILELIATMAS